MSQCTKTRVAKDGDSYYCMLPAGHGGTHLFADQGEPTVLQLVERIGYLEDAVTDLQVQVSNLVRGESNDNTT